MKASHPASVGERVITSTFTQTTSRGFATANNEEKADECVCLIPGTELAFDSSIVTAPKFCGEGERVLGFSVGRFKQVDADQKFTHHDALELPDGMVVKLDDLKPGQTATVLQLPAAPKTEAEAKEQARLEVVA